MHAIHKTEDRTSVETLAPSLIKVGAILAVLGLGAAAFVGLRGEDGGKHFWFSYLHNLTFVLTISLGALFFVILQHLTRAGWSAALRRIAEFMTGNLWILAIAFLPILLQVLSHKTTIYIWLDEELAQNDHLIHAKHGYLNASFFAARCVFYFVVWTGLARFYGKRSLAQDHNGDLKHTVTMQKFSPISMLLFASTLTFAAFDILMSLDPHWYSTMFGVYIFAGTVLSFLAACILMTRYVQSHGALTKTVTVEHYHDLGKLQFGFVFFWSYIAFSQFMLYWYANIPEETIWYKHRMEGGWTNWSWALLFGHFAIPFIGLISRHAKRRLPILSFWAAYLLVMHWVDLYWLIMPNLDPHHAPFGLVDVACCVGMVGLWLAGFGVASKGKNLLAVRDPRLNESLAFQNF